MIQLLWHHPEFLPKLHENRSVCSMSENCAFGACGQTRVSKRRKDARKKISFTVSSNVNRGVVSVPAFHILKMKVCDRILAFIDAVDNPFAEEYILL